MSEPYQVYTILDPRPEDAPNLRRMWAIVRRQGGRLYEFRRKLAHDYWLAKCAGKEVDAPPDPDCINDPFKHQFTEEYYGWRCQKCNQFVPFGSEYWMPLD